MKNENMENTNSQEPKPEPINGLFDPNEIHVLKKIALATSGASFTQDEVEALRDMLKFTERVQWLVKTLAIAAKWLSVVFGGYLVLTQMGLFH